MDLELAAERERNQQFVNQAASSSQPSQPADAQESPRASSQELQHLVSMGFSRRRSLAALDAHQGSAEDAVAELLREDTDQQTPAQSLQAMGFGAQQALAALDRARGDVQLALEEAFDIVMGSIAQRPSLAIFIALAFP
ncbi:unnamed protein product [Effrenium voratum]|nr:unnamed protein product [Effrenium voratum]